MQLLSLKNLRPLLVAFTLLLCAGAHAAPRGEDLLRAMLRAEQEVSYSATETTTRAGGATVVARIQKSDGKKRLEYSAPAIMRGDLLIDDGHTLWRYHRAEKSAIKTKTSAQKNAPDWNDLKAHVTATVQGRSTLGGRAAWILVVSSRQKKRVSRKIWIDDKTKIRLRTQRFDERGQVRETTTLSNLKFGAVPASAFHWTPPRGIEVTNAGTLYTQLNQAQRNASWLRAPAKLPSGYAFESAVVNSSEAWLRYSNGTRRFSIFQQHTGDSKSTPLRRAGSGWYWQQGGSRFLIAGLPEAQAKSVAQSVR